MTRRFGAHWRPPVSNSSMRTGVAPVCASKSALGQNQLGDSGMGQEGQSQIGELRFVPKCLSDKKLNNWIIGNRQRPLSDARAAANRNQSSIEIIRSFPANSALVKFIR